jgi:hypothetical protein
MVCKVFHIPWDFCERSRTSLHELKAEVSNTEDTEGTEKKKKRKSSYPLFFLRL